MLSGIDRNILKELILGGLYLRVMFALVICVILVLGVATALIVRDSQSQLTNELLERGQAQAAILAQASSVFFVNDDPYRLELLAGTATSAKEIQYVAFYTEAGAFYAGKGADGVSAAALAPFDAQELQANSIGLVRWTNGYLEIAKPVYAHQRMGTVAIRITTDQLASSSSGIVNQSIGLAVVLVLVLVGALGLLLRRLVIHPVQQLSTASKLIMAGNWVVPPNQERHDELGLLARSFGQMLETLRTREQQLQEQFAAVQTLNAELDMRVAQRTVELEQAMQDAHEARAIAERADQLKTKFLANMSHELRTPLNVIINFSELMLSGMFGELDEQKEKLQRRVLANGEHLLGLINDILDLSKIEAGKMELIREEMNLQTTLEGVLSTTLGITKDKNISVMLDTPEDELPLVWADKTRIRQVLLNLLSNAAKFTDHGSITIKAHDRSDGFVEISVSDTGIGIAPEHLSSIFNEFQQIYDNHNRHYQGTGLGLSICKKFIEMHGGQIWVESTLGVGSTFRCTVPIISHNQTNLPALIPTTTEAFVEEGLGRNGTIVTVDDNPDAQVILQHCLEADGWHVHGVLDSRLAIDEIRRVQPTLIVLDIQMPYLDGWAVLNHLQQEPDLSSVPVIVCSIVDSAKGRMGMLPGIGAWISKPVREAELLMAVQRYAEPSSEVLIVDDNVDVRLIVRSTLEKGGWHVVEAVDGEQALTYLEQQQPCLVILDLMMPNIDGFQVLERIRAIPGQENLPVVVFTAKDLDEQELLWLTMRTQHCCQKDTFSVTEFPALLRTLIHRGDHNVYRPTRNGTHCRG